MTEKNGLQKAERYSRCRLLGNLFQNNGPTTAKLLCWTEEVWAIGTNQITVCNKTKKPATRGQRDQRRSMLDNYT